MKNRILLISLALLLAVSVTAIGCPPPPVEVVEEVVPWPGYPEPEFEWKVQSTWPAGVWNYEVFVEFTERVYEMSGGRLIIHPFSVGAVVCGFKVMDAVIAGVLDGMHSYPAFWTGKDPAFAALSGMPASFPEFPQFGAWYWEGGGMELARELYAEFGLHLVGMVISGPESLHFRVPVTSAADLEGLKIRTPHGMAADLMARLGASVVIIPGGEIYTALAKGLIDGADFMTLSFNVALGFHEVARYFMTEGFHKPMQAMEFAVCKDVWNALPADLQAIVEAAVRVWSATEGYRAIVKDRAAEKKILALGNVHLYFPEAELAKVREVAMEIWDEWKEKSPWAAKVIESQLEFKRFLGIIE